MKYLIIIEWGWSGTKKPKFISALPCLRVWRKILTLFSPQRQGKLNLTWDGSTPDKKLTLRVVIKQTSY